MGSADCVNGLSQTDIDAAHFALREYLRRWKGFSRDFIDRHSAELLAQARLELSRHLAAGEEIRSPVGWLLTCAERRAKSQVEWESRVPALVPLDPELPVADDSALDPEEEILREDRYHQVQEAVDRLRRDEREVIKLIYFDELSIREAGKELNWDKSKVSARKLAALEHLREFLHVDSLDSLQIAAGAAAWVANGGTRGRFNLTAPLEALSRFASDLLTRSPQPAQSALTGGATETAAAGASSIGPGLRVCGATLLTCIAATFASGVVGPGVGAVHLLGSPSPSRRAKPPQPVARQTSQTTLSALAAREEQPLPPSGAPAVQEPEETASTPARAGGPAPSHPGRAQSPRESNPNHTAGETIRPIEKLAHEAKHSPKASASVAPAELEPEHEAPPAEPPPSPEPAPPPESAPAPPPPSSAAAKANGEVQNLWPIK
jgi:RNA polymerase sigma factor (sigma-70 family)